MEFRGNPIYMENKKILYLSTKRPERKIQETTDLVSIMFLGKIMQLMEAILRQLKGLWRACEVKIVFAPWGSPSVTSSPILYPVFSDCEKILLKLYVINLTVIRASVSLANMVPLLFPPCFTSVVCVLINVERELHWWTHSSVRVYPLLLPFISCLRKYFAIQKPFG